MRSGTGNGLLPVIVLALVSPMLLGGCGGPDSISRRTPEATARAFVEAMKAGDYDAVARGYDFESWARRENPDWDTFGAHQRQLIVEELQNARARELRAMSGMFTGEMTVGEVVERNDRAQVLVTAGATPLMLYMTQIEQDWYLRRIEEGTPD